MRTDETFIHVAVRRFLKRCGWCLVAGQYPGGSDDECYALNVMDPTVACDNSPDPRRHSDNKLVPDLFALKSGVLLIIEMKPAYSPEDEAKLVNLVTARRTDLWTAMRTFGRERGVPELEDPDKLAMVLALGFAADARYIRNPDFAYFLVSDLDIVELLQPERTPPAHVINALKGG